MKTFIRGWEYEPPALQDFRGARVPPRGHRNIRVQGSGGRRAAGRGPRALLHRHRPATNRTGWEHMTPFRWVMVTALLVTPLVDYFVDTPVTHTVWRTVQWVFIVWLIANRPHIRQYWRDAEPSDSRLYPGYNSSGNYPALRGDSWWHFFNEATCSVGLDPGSPVRHGGLAGCRACDAPIVWQRRPVGAPRVIAVVVPIAVLMFRQVRRGRWSNVDASNLPNGRYCSWSLLLVWLPRSGGSFSTTRSRSSCGACSRGGVSSPRGSPHSLGQALAPRRRTDRAATGLSVEQS